MRGVVAKTGINDDLGLHTGPVSFANSVFLHRNSHLRQIESSPGTNLLFSVSQRKNSVPRQPGSPPPWLGNHTWFEGRRYLLMAGCALDESTESQAPGHFGGRGGERLRWWLRGNRAQPPAFVLRLILGCRGPDFLASGIYAQCWVWFFSSATW